MNGITVIKAKTTIAILVLLVASFVVICSTVEDSDASSSDYRFSGELMESLSSSNGINDVTIDTVWSKENVRGYAVAGEYIYASFKTGDLQKIEIKTGQVVKTVPTGKDSGVDYVSVGDNYVLDPASGNVYDLDLNKLYSLGTSSDQGYYDDGYWYVVKADKTCTCFSAKDEDKSSADNVQSQKWSQKFFFYIDSFTLTVSLAFGDKCLFYPGIGESDTAKRIVYSVNKATGDLKDSFEMTEIQSTFWNSGFIQCFDDTVIVTTHWDSMFAPPRLGDDYKTIFLIDVGSDGKFKSDTAKYWSNGYNDSYGSCMIVVGGLGFAQTGLSFKVFDMKDGKIKATTDVDSRLGKTYSNIAVAAGDDGFVRGYVSPAGAPNPLSPVDGLICFEYNKKTGDIRSFDIKVGTPQTDNTNPIKIGPNGEVIFAKNDGKLYCITSTIQPSSGFDMPIWAIVLIVLLVIAVIAAVFFVRKKKSSIDG